jgi:hypothetical protein
MIVDGKRIWKEDLTGGSSMTQEDGSAPVPGWIKERQLEKAADDRKVTEISQKQLDASKLVRERGREYWLRLLDRLKFNTDALPTLGEELYGSTSPMGDPAGKGEVSCHIQVDRRSVTPGPALSHTNLFFQPGGNRIRLWYQDQSMGDLELQPSGEGLVAVVGDGTALTAQELADYLVRRMAERIAR